MSSKEKMDNILYYEAREKIESLWIDNKSVSHDFANGKGRIVLKNSAKKIDDFGFPELISVVIPDSVAEIGVNAFEDCASMREVKIGDSVKKIGDFAFFGCRGLTSVVIPHSVETIGEDAFKGCGNLLEKTRIKICEMTEHRIF